MQFGIHFPTLIISALIAHSGGDFGESFIIGPGIIFCVITIILSIVIIIHLVKEKKNPNYDKPINNPEIDDWIDKYIEEEEPELEKQEEI